MINEGAIQEQWNLLNLAEMAVQVRNVLYKTLKQKPLPLNYKEILEKGIAFLVEAKNGGAIISGTFQSHSFDGSLSPLCWVADI